MWGSKPFDFFVMGKDYHIMGEAKNWATYPPDAVERFKKQYEGFAKMATGYGCDAILYLKHGRGKYNYTMHRLN